MKNVALILLFISASAFADSPSSINLAPRYKPGQGVDESLNKKPTPMDRYCLTSKGQRYKIGTTLEADNCRKDSGAIETVGEGGEPIRPLNAYLPERKTTPTNLNPPRNIDPSVNSHLTTPDGTPGRNYDPLAQ